MSNLKKWLLVLGLSFGSGFLADLTDDKPGGVKSALKHGGATLVPAVIALNMTLQRANQTEDPLKSNAAAGGE